MHPHLHGLLYGKCNASGTGTLWPPGLNHKIGFLWPCCATWGGFSSWPLGPPGSLDPPNPAEPRRTKPNHTEPARAPPPQTEADLTTAGCSPEGAPRRTKKNRFCGLTRGVTRAASTVLRFDMRSWVLGVPEEFALAGALRLWGLPGRVVFYLPTPRTKRRPRKNNAAVCTNHLRPDRPPDKETGGRKRPPPTATSYS